MDNNNGSPPQGGEPAMDAGDWRSHLQADTRQRIVNKLMDILKRHIPCSSEDELKKLAVQFDEKIYVAATSQSDYLRKLSLKMLAMETKSRNTMANSLQSNSVGSSGMKPQVTNQGQLLPENIQSNILPAGVQNSTGLSSALPPTSGPQQQILPPQHQQQQLIASLDSTAQTGHTNGADWQEEVYQKIKVMKDMYYPELSEMYQKIATKLHQHDSLPQQPKSDQLEKLKMFKTILERLITVLQISKTNISPGLKEKLGLYKKQMINFINTNRPRKPVSSLQPGQLPPPHMQSMQQSQSQITQVQSHENQMNPQLQSLNLQGSVPTMQQNNMTGLQQNSMSSLSGFSTTQQNMMNPLQPSSNMDPGQGYPLYSSQQVPVSTIQEISVSGPQQANKNALSSHSGINMLTMETKTQNTIANSLQSNSAGSSGMQPQVTNQGQLLSENIQSNIPPAGVQNSAGLSSALPPTSGPEQQILPPQHQQQQLIAQTGNTNGADWTDWKEELHIFRQQRQKELQQQLPGQLQPELHQISVVNDVNTNALSSSLSGINMLQANVIPPSILQKQRVYQNQLQIQLLHQQQMQQLVEKLQRIQQQQQAKQQVPGLSQAHQLPQLHQISVVKDVNVDTSSSQTGSSMLQANIDPPQPNSIIVDNKHLKQDQEQKMFQNQLKQPYQQQWMQKQQMLQEMQQLQIQQLQQQAKQQLHHIYVIYLIFLTILLGAAFFGTGY